MAAEQPLRHVLMTADTVGGVWTHVLELASGLGQRGVHVWLATMGASLTPGQRAQAAALPRLELHESRWKLEWMAQPWDDVRRAGDWLRELEARLRPDLVHLNQFAFGALRFGAPTLLVAHSCVLSWWRAVHGERAPGAWDTYRQVVRRGLEGADRVGAPTRAMLEALAREHRFTRPGLVLPNGRDPALFRPGPKAQAILAAGRFWDPAKNLSALQVVAPWLSWPVRVAGALAPPGEGGIPECTHGGGSAGVRWLGELAPQALAAQMARAAIYVLPARYEPFGQSALEAGMAGCALVLGDVPSLREVWGDAASYVAPGDSSALHATLTRLIDDAPLRAHMSRLAQARARYFSPSRMVDAYLSAYADVRTCAAPEQKEMPCDS